MMEKRFIEAVRELVAKAVDEEIEKQVADFESRLQQRRFEIIGGIMNSFDIRASNDLLGNYTIQINVKGRGYNER